MIEAERPNTDEAIGPTSEGQDLRRRRADTEQHEMVVRAIGTGSVFPAPEVAVPDPLRELPPMLPAETVAGRRVLRVVRQRNEAAFPVSQTFQNYPRCPSAPPVDPARETLTTAKLRPRAFKGADAEHETVSTVRIKS